MALKNRSNKLLPQSPVGLMQILKRCSSFGKHHHREEDGLPDDVPKGHFVVYVGEHRTRFIVPISCLDHPVFRNLLHESEELYGFKYDMGIIIPCKEIAFRSFIMELYMQSMM